jgi:amidohydrolase
MLILFQNPEVRFQSKLEMTLLTGTDLKRDSTEELINLRRNIHSEPELAGNEINTSEKINKFISAYSPDETIKNIGGSGIAFVFKGEGEGPAVLFRAELDALPIDEINDFDYKSKYKDKGHKCGHDGHMTILAGLARRISSSRKFNGKFILLFQPAEETGEGAERVLKDNKFSGMTPDYVFAFHNLPGFKSGSIITRDSSFASASKGMIIKLTGKTSHAAEPENGINPSIAVSEIIRKFSALPDELKAAKEFVLTTIIYVRIGERAFGTSPGYAELMATLRAYRNEDMDLLIGEAEKIARTIASDQQLKIEINYTEEFPATVNDAGCSRIIRKAAEENGYPVTNVSKPFRWSEDFGHFTGKFRGAMFGIGSGENHPQLHNPDYDFPDEIIPVGINMFYTIMQKIQNRK